MIRLACTLAVAGCITLTAQQRTIHIAAPQPTIVAGLTTQLDATVRDNTGAVVNGVAVTWSAGQTDVLTVDPQGLVTGHRPGVVTINASAQNALTVGVRIQVVPARIEVEPANKVVRVGESIEYSARALNASGEPIENVAFTWQSVGANGFGLNAGRISPSGVVVTNAIGRVTIRAIIRYNNTSQNMVVESTGATTLEIVPVSGYRLRRLLASDEAPLIARLRPIPTVISVSPAGHLAFIGGLDGYSSAIVLWQNGRLEAIVSTGTPGPLPGNPIDGFAGVSVNSQGQVLTYASGAGGGFGNNWNGLMLATRDGWRMAFLNNTRAAGADSVSLYGISPYSLNDRGDIAATGSYNNPDRTVVPAVFRIPSGGVPEPVWRGDSNLPGLAAPLNFPSAAIDGTGAVYFRAASQNTEALYRSEGFAVPQRIVGTGDLVGGLRITRMRDFILTPAGEIVVSLESNEPGRPAEYALARIPKGSAPVDWRVLRGQYSWSPRGATAKSVLVSGFGSRANGLYQWNADDTLTPQMYYGKLLPNNEPLSGIYGAGMTAAGSVIAQVSSPNTGLIFLKDDALIIDPNSPVTGQGSIQFVSFTSGFSPGTPHLYLGRNEFSSVFEYDGGYLYPRFLTGEPGPGGFNFNTGWVYKGPDGDLWITAGNDLYRITGGRAIQQFGACGDGTCFGAPNVVGVDSAGSVLWSVGSSSGFPALYLTRGGRQTFLGLWISQNSSPPSSGDIAIMGFPAMNANGQVMATIVSRTMPLTVGLYENGRWTELVSLNAPWLDVAAFEGASGFAASGSGFFVNSFTRFDGTQVAQFSDGNWTSIVRRYDPTPSGGEVNSAGTLRTNNRGDLAMILFWGGNTSLAVRRVDGSTRHVMVTGDALPDGSYCARVNDFVIADDGRVFLLLTDLDDRIIFYVAEPVE